MEIGVFDKPDGFFDIRSDKGRAETFANFFQEAGFVFFCVKYKDILIAHDTTGFKPRLSSIFKE